MGSSRFGEVTKADLATLVDISGIPEEGEVRGSELYGWWEVIYTGAM